MLRCHRPAPRSWPADLIPVFAFGQSHALDWLRPGPPIFSEARVQQLSRSIGFVPLLTWGWMGTTIPKPVKMTVVVGKPIPAPKTPSPTDALVGFGLLRRACTTLAACRPGTAYNGEQVVTSLAVWWHALQVQETLDTYISSLRALFDKHKASAGYPTLQLDIM
jgi:2-acylglycerol O-acyltransferase 2